VDKVALTKAVKERTGTTYQEAKPIVDAVFQVMAEAMRRGEQVRIADFCTFDTVVRARKVINPQTGERYSLPPRREPWIKPGAILKRMLKEPYE